MNFYPARVAPQDLFRKNSQLHGILDTPAELAALSLRKPSVQIAHLDLVDLVVLDLED